MVMGFFPLFSCFQLIFNKIILNNKPTLKVQIALVDVEERVIAKVKQHKGWWWGGHNDGGDGREGETYSHHGCVVT
jgi:hypothetical protein